MSPSQVLGNDLTLSHFTLGCMDIIYQQNKLNIYAIITVFCLHYTEGKKKLCKPFTAFSIIIIFIPQRVLTEKRNKIFGKSIQFMIHVHVIV